MAKRGFLLTYIVLKNYLNKKKEIIYYFALKLNRNAVGKNMIVAIYYVGVYESHSLLTELFKAVYLFD